MRFVAVQFDRETLAQLQAADWEAILPGYQNFPTQFKSCVPMLFASIVLHADFLASQMPQNHPLFSAQVFASGSVSRFKGRVLTGRVKCDKTGLVAEGLPPFMITEHWKRNEWPSSTRFTPFQRLSKKSF